MDVKESKDCILMGELLVHSIFGFKKQICKLYNNRIKIGYKVKSRFNINSACVISENSTRAFCFTIRDLGTDRQVTVATTTYFQKDQWLSALKKVISDLQKKKEGGDGALSTGDAGDAGDADGGKVGPALYVKVMKTRDLFRSIAPINLANDSEGDGMKIYVNITVGSSSVRTVSRTVAQKDPEWGMVFPFEHWDSMVRYALVEVCLEQQMVSRSSLLGVARIPTYSLYQSAPNLQWYPLMRPKQDGSRGAYAFAEIEIELSTNGLHPDRDQLGWRLLLEAQRLSGMQLPLLNKEDANTDVLTREIYEALETAEVDMEKKGKGKETTLQGDGAGAELLTVPVPVSVEEHVQRLHTDPAGALRRKAVLEVKNLMEMYYDQPSVIEARSNLKQGSIVKTQPSLGEVDLIPRKNSAVAGEGGISSYFDPTDVDVNGEVALASSELRKSQSSRRDESTATETEDGLLDGESVTLLDRINCFPYCLPTLEQEQLEDMSMSVSLLNRMDRSEVAVRGVLLLTNYRLIFLSTTRIFTGDGPEWDRFRAYDVSTFVAIEQICKVEKPEHETLSASGGGGGGGGSSTDKMETYYLTLRTTDARVLHFQFHERRVPWDVLRKQSYSTIRRPLESMGLVSHELPREDHQQLHDGPTTGGGGGRIGDLAAGAAAGDTEIEGDEPSMHNHRHHHHHHHHHHHQHHEHGTPLAAVLKDLYERSTDSVEGLSSPEGPPAIRLYQRLRLRCINRLVEHREVTELHSSLLKSVRRSVADVPDLPHLQKSLNINNEIFCMSDEQRFDLFKAPPSSASSSSEEKESKSTTETIHRMEGKGDEEGMGQVDQQSVVELLRRSYSLVSFQEALHATPHHIRMYLRAYLRNGWDIYDPEAEFRRLGIPSSAWRLTEVNHSYEMCATYPSMLIVPNGVSDKILKESAKFRSKGRIPTLVWRSSGNGCTISRCSQPMVGISNFRNTSDETLVRAIHLASDSESVDNEARGHQPLIVIDARPQLNAQANQMAGKGYENAKVYDNIAVQWMDMDNIHVVRDSADLMESATYSNKSWMTNLESSNWLKHVHKALNAAIKIVQLVAIEKKSVLVHCSDGWDRTPQLTSLGMLMLDPYYRSLEGFIVLIEKEWLSFGHKFADRQAWSMAGFKDEEKSPIFIQWLDCVFQCLQQHPQDFQFNHALLCFIAKYATCGWFGTFMYNCEKDRASHQARFYTLSVWSVVLSRQKEYINPTYIPNLGLSCPIPLKQCLVFWDKYFCRFTSHLFMAAWLSNYDDERLLENENEVSTNAERRASAPRPPAKMKTREKLLGKLFTGSSGGGDKKSENGGADGSRMSDWRGSQDTKDSGAARKSLSNWADDQSVNACSRCSVRFTSFLRKHHCRRCGLIFCSSCSEKKRVIKDVKGGWTTSSVRVCEDCAGTIDEMTAAGQTPGSAHQQGGEGIASVDRSITTEAGKDKKRDSIGVDRRQSAYRRRSSSRRYSAGRERLSLQQISAMSSVARINSGSGLATPASGEDGMESDSSSSSGDSANSHSSSGSNSSSSPSIR